MTPFTFHRVKRIGTPPGWPGLAGAVVIALAMPAMAGFGTHISTGQEVEVKMLERGGPLRARKITVALTDEGPDARDPLAVTVRGRIDRVDPSRNTVTILGRGVRITGRTRVPSSIRTLDDLKEGAWVKVYATVADGGNWEADRIRVNDIKHSVKVQGRVSDLWGMDSLAVQGLVVRTGRNVPIYEGDPTASERLFRKIIDPRNPHRAPAWLADERFWSRGKARVIQRVENDYAIGDSSRDHYREAEPQVKLEFLARGPRGLSGTLHLRSRGRSVLKDAPLRQDDGRKALEVYEAFGLWRDVLGTPAAIQIGRQDFDEDREWLFDDQLDAIRGYLYPLYPIVAEVAYINSLDNSSTNKFRTLRDYLVYVHGRVASSVELGAYRLWRTDRDQRGREPIWTGVRYRGEHFGLRPWAELSWMRGWDKGRRLDGAASDLGVTAVRRVGDAALSLTAGHAHASGNTQEPRRTGIDQRFVQTGYEDNTATIDGVVSLSYYGTILDPELANMDILTLGGGCRVRDAFSVEVFYHRYRQAEYSEGVAREIESTDLTVFDMGGRGIDPANGRPVTDLFPYRDIGTELDIVVGIRRVLGVAEIKWILGFFSPGEALSPPFWEQLPFRPKKRTAFLSQLGIEWQF